MSGAIGRYQSVYNPTDLGDTVGSYLLASDGTELTHTGGALDVNIASGADFDIRDLDSAQDNIEIQTAAGQAMAIDGSGFLTVNGNGNFAVTATDLDIRNLLFATDKVDVSASVIALDAATLAALETTTVIATDLDIRSLVFATDKVDVSGSSVTATATDFDIRDLTSASDSVEIQTAAGQALDIEADGSINVNSTASGYASCAYAAKSVTTTVTQLFASALSLRKSVLMQNRGNKSAFVGCDASVTTANGIEVPAGGTIELNFGPTVDLHAITATGTADFRLIEAA